ECLVMVGQPPRCCLDNLTLETCWLAMTCPDAACGRFAALPPSGPWRLPSRLFPMCYGTELTSNAVLSWCGEIGVEWHYIAPGKPMQNGYVERLASPPFGSTAACATSCSMRRCSSAWITLAPRSPRGWKTTTASDRTQPLDTKPRRRSPPNCKSN